MGSHLEDPLAGCIIVKTNEQILEKIHHLPVYRPALIVIPKLRQGVYCTTVIPGLLLPWSIELVPERSALILKVVHHAPQVGDFVRHDQKLCAEIGLLQRCDRPRLALLPAL